MEKVVIDEYIIDPDGDAMYVLEKPNKPVIIETSIKKRTVIVEDSPPGKRARTRADCRNADCLQNCAPDEIRFQVSSKHLALASPVFHAMVNGNWTESFSVPTGSDGASRREIRASEFDSEAVLLLMRILHHQFKDIPYELNLPELANLATIVDYYGCHEVVRVHIERWVDFLRSPANFGKIPYADRGEDVIRWLSVSWVFSYPKIFHHMAEIILRHSQCPVHAPDLPIAPILPVIEAKKQKMVSRAFDYLARITNNLLEGQTNCTVPDCASMLLGTLMRATKHIEHLKNEKTRPANGYSLTDIVEAFSSYRKPNWASIRNDPLGNSIPTIHRCTLEQFMFKPIRRIEAEFHWELWYELLPGWTPEVVTQSRRPTKPTRLVENRPIAL